MASTPARVAADAISARFAHGGPSNDPEVMGVLIHVWDQLEDPGLPWMPCLRTSVCKHTERGRLDRLPSSLIYKGMPNRGKNNSVPMFSDGLRGGLILRPTASEVRCGYPADGHSRWNSDGCACPFVGDIAKGKKDRNDCSRWCDDPIGSGSMDSARGINRNVRELRCGGRPWRPSQLGAMLSRAAAVTMEQRMPWGGLGRETWTGSENNELVVSPSTWNASADVQIAAWNASLPRMVQAFWYPVSAYGPCCNHDAPHVRCIAHCGERERNARADFLKAYGLSEADGPPLLELRRDDWERPFRLKCGGDAGGGDGGDAAGRDASGRGHHWCTGGAADAGSHASGNRHHANGRAGLSVVDSATQSNAASPGGGLWAASFRSRHPPRIGRAI
jgi:hypothetical protein